MSEDDILSRLTPLFRETFDNDEIVLSEKTTARDIDGWDSVGNIRLMLSVESEFSFTFEVGEFSDFRNVGDLVSSIQRRLGS
jgi:acyl carrier protein